jgi:hypothetical protein
VVVAFKGARAMKEIFIIATALFLASCTQTEYVYKEVPREPITCIERIKTPLDMAKCLAEYKAKY